MSDTRRVWIKVSDQTGSVYIKIGALVDDLIKEIINAKEQFILHYPIHHIILNDVFLNAEDPVPQADKYYLVHFSQPLAVQAPVIKNVPLEKLERNPAWIIRNAQIFSLDQSKKFNCDILVDTGCRATQLRLPFRKCEQLGLNEIGRGETNQGTIIHFTPVLLELPTIDGERLIRAVNPSSTIPSPSHKVPEYRLPQPIIPLEGKGHQTDEKQETSTKHWGKRPHSPTKTSPSTSAQQDTLPPTTPQQDTLPPTTSQQDTLPPTTPQQLPTTSQQLPPTTPQQNPETRWPPAVIQLSPVTYPATSHQHQTVLLGVSGFAAFGLDLDTKRNCLYYLDDI